MTEEEKSDTPNRMGVTVSSPVAITDIVQRLSACEQHVRRLERRLDSVSSMLVDGANIDLIDLGDYVGFMSTADFGYDELPESSKRQTLNGMCISDCDAHGQRRLSSRLLKQPLAVMFRHCRQANTGFIYVDVGARYGFGLVEAALLAQHLGQHRPLYGFEPGPAGLLLPHTIKANNLDESICFRPYAIGARSHLGVLRSERGQSQNAALGPVPASNPDTRSWIVPVVSLDDFFGTEIDDVILIVKIDTQGTEIDVLRGMERLRSKLRIMCLLEITPDQLSAEDVSYLHNWTEDCVLVDMGQVPHGDPVNLAYGIGTACNAFSPSGLDHFFNSVRTRPYGWSDLLIVPAGIQNRDALLEELSRCCSTQSKTNEPGR